MFINKMNYIDLSDINPSNFNNKGLHCELKIIKQIYNNLEHINHKETTKKNKYRDFFINIQNKKLLIKKQKAEEKILDRLKEQGKKAVIKKFNIPIYISQHTMKQKHTDKVRQYRAIAAGRKIINDFEQDDIENLLEETNIEIYRTTWSKLSESLKYNRIYKFIENLKTKYNLTKENTEFIQKKLFEAIKNRIITKSGQVEYNADTGKIISIDCLEYNEIENKFTIKV
jgi:hypothetical protein